MADTLFDFLSSLKVLGLELETGYGFSISKKGFKPAPLLALKIASIGDNIDFKLVADKLNSVGLAGGYALKKFNKGKTKIKLNIGALIDIKDTEFKKTKPKLFLGFTIGK